MACLFTDRPEYAGTRLFTFENNGNNNGLPFSCKSFTTCQLIPHRHSYIQIVYIRKGQLTHVCGSHIDDLHSGALLLMPPFLPHYFIPIQERSFDLLEYEFDASFIDSTLRENVPFDGCQALSWLSPYTDGHTFPLVFLSGSEDFSIRTVLSEIEQEYAHRAENFEAMIQGLTIRLLTLIYRAILHQTAQNGETLLYERHREVLLQSLDFIRDNFTKNISIHDAAQVAIMSPSYYRHYFKLLTGKTFIEYLNALRISYSITLIRKEPHRKIIDICYASGFSNISHFNRTFLKITGVTPKDFRCSSLEKDDSTDPVI